MCGPSSSSGREPNSITVSITPAGVIRIETGTMTTMHANVGDAIAALTRLAGVSIVERESLAKALHAHVHHEHEHDKAR
jgi:hypothetical protein